MFRINENVKGNNAEPPQRTDTESPQPAERRIEIFLVLFLAGLLYIALFPRWVVGMANDDALYLLAAKSLLQGHYVSLQFPNHPPLNDPLPGYSVFLAPLFLLFREHWAWLKVSSVLLTLGSGYLLWQLIGLRIHSYWRWFAVLLWALHPAVASFAPSLMAEPLFVFLVLLFLFLLQRSLTGNKILCSVAASFVLSWLVLVRPQGILLWAATLVALRWRNVQVKPRGIFLLPLAGFLLFGVRSVALTHHWSGYIHPWMSGRSAVLPVQTWIAMLSTLIRDGLFAGFAISSLGILFLVAAVGLFVVYVVLKKEAGQSEVFDVLLATVTLFCLADGLLQTLWVSVSIRYFLPLLPFGFWFVALFVHAYRNRPQAKTILTGFGLLLLVGYVRLDAQLLERRFHASAEMSQIVPQETYRWISAHTAENSFILSSKPSTLCLYTHRYATFAKPAESETNFVNALRNGHVTHVLLQPSSIAAPGWAMMWEQVREWILSSPKDFQPIYENQKEETRLFILRKHNP